MSLHPELTAQVLVDIRRERGLQDRKWGEQNHPDGTHSREFDSVFDSVIADIKKTECNAAFKAGNGTWSHILAEEFYEAMAEKDPKLLRAELIQVAAVCVSWIECIDRRSKKEGK